jgi:hypothetical protein
MKIETGHRPSYICVLWGEGLDEEGAVAFLVALRRQGLPAKLVGIHQAESRGLHGVVLKADMGLSALLPLASQISHIIIPGSTDDIQRFRQDPRLADLLQQVVEKGGELLVQVGCSEPDREIPGWLAGNPIPFPHGQALHTFVREWSQRLAYV